MSSFNIFPCQFILEESFGSTVNRVGSFLLKHPPCSLRLLCTEIALSSEQIKKAICCLLQQNIANFEKNKRGIIEYTVCPSNVLTRIRFPRFIYSAKTLYGDMAELLVEELVGVGRMQMSVLVEKVKDRLNDSLPEGQKVTVHQVKEKFVYLVKTHFLQRCPGGTANNDDDEDDNPDRDLYTIPAVDLELLAKRKRKRESAESADQPAAKRAKLDDSDPLPDEHVYWRVNVERFDQHLRDQHLIRALASKIDPKAGEILRTMLRVSETVTDSSAPITNPISATEIYNALPKEICSVRPALDQYLSVMADDTSSFIRKEGDSGGGMYRVDLKKAFHSLATAHVESVVQERFGSKCLRIFRLLMLKRRLEQKQIEESAMIPAKEAKEMLYTMFAQNFVHLTEIPRTPDHAPARTFYLFSVDLNQVARMLLQVCYKTLSNLMCKREQETREHRRVLEKEQRVAAILASLEQQGADDTQRAEVQEMITPAEKTQLAKVKHVTNKLERSELQLDSTIFVLEKYLHYDNMS